jgi:Winged helix DNA-binding domain
MTALPSIPAAERRARIAIRHRVAPGHRAADIVTATRDMVCLHATDPATVYLSSWARVDDVSVEDVDAALYEERSLLRMLAMRRTMFVVAVDEAPILHAAASLGVARNERRRNQQIVGMLGVDDADTWLREAEDATLAALGRRGEATAQELAKDVPALRERVRVNVGKRYEGAIGLSSRVLLLLAVEGRIVRARPRGTWISSQYRWTPIERWLGRPMPELPVADAQAELVRRWLGRFGPGTEGDLRWWTGLTAREIRPALERAGAVQVDLDGQLGYVLPDDLESTPPPEPWVALLPWLDPTTMGWQEREWYLGAYKPRLFDSNGNAGPTIWSDGRIVGGWTIREGGEVVTQLFEDVGRAVEAAVEVEAARLTTWLHATRVTPRFVTPIDRELALAARR